MLATSTLVRRQSATGIAQATANVTTRRTSAIALQVLPHHIVLNSGALQTALDTASATPLMVFVRATSFGMLKKIVPKIRFAPINAEVPTKVHAMQMMANAFASMAGVEKIAIQIRVHVQQTVTNVVVCKAIALLKGASASQGGLERIVV